MSKNVVLPEGFFNGVDVVALATTVNQPCSGCGHRHDGVGLIARGGGLFCQRCGFRTEARAAKTKRQRRPRAEWRPRVRMPPPTSSRHCRERRRAAPHVNGGGRDGTGERDDGSGSGDSDGGGGEPPGPRSHAPFAGGVR
jgi:hypothetical protein